MLCCRAQFLTFCHHLQCQAFLLDCLPNDTVSYPRRPESSTQFSVCDNLYAFPYERLQPSGQTMNLTTRHLKSGHEKNEHIFFTIWCAVASCLPAFAHCHQFSLVLQGSFCLELLCSVFSWYWQIAVVPCRRVEEQVTDGLKPHSLSWFFLHINYSIKIVLSIKGYVCYTLRRCL
jgi:hypothetical protein